VSSPANVVLIGLSGSGKTTVAKLLARRLGWRFVDTDHEIERRAGQSVAEIFGQQGEPAFRALESEVIQDTCARSHQVIATGGGAVIDAGNRARLVDGNLVIWLDSTAERLAERLAHSVSRHPRPLLASADLAARLDELAREREPHYRCAHHVVNTDRQTPSEVADALARLVRGR